MFKYLTFTAALFLCVHSFGQTGIVRGFIYDQNTSEPLIFTSAILAGTPYGATTDVNGFFSITKLPAGQYTLTVSALGYEKFSEQIQVVEGKVLNKKIYLVPSGIEINTVEISAEKKEARKDIQMSVSKITAKEINTLPSVGGEPDLAQYLQVLPGVIFTGDQGGQLYVRGGSPIQNKVMMDGMIIYNPFHSIGLYSVFDTELIRNADAYTGGFGAQYGGRISSVIDITTRDGNKNRLAGMVGVSPFGAKITLEGPIKKQKAEGGSSSFVISARNSYLKQSSKIFYNYVNEDGSGLPFNFRDLYGKASFYTDNGSKFNVFGFNFTDDVRYLGVSDLGWENTGAGANFVVIPGTSPTLIEGNFSVSNYRIALTEPGLQERSSSIGGFNLGLDFTYFAGEDEVKYGISVLGFGTEYGFYNAFNMRSSQDENTTELASYVTWRINRGLLVIEPGFRAHYYASLSELSPEPRLGVKYNVNENFRLKAAAGLYSQNLVAANSDRDVVNLFYGFLSGPTNLQDSYTDRNGSIRERKSSLQKARHYIAGFEADLNRRFNVNVEAYIKDFTQLTNTNRERKFEDNTENIEVPDNLKKEFIIETGLARGIDFVFKYQFTKAYLYAVYSLSKVDRFDGQDLYYPVFDRRHNINLVGNYIFGKKGDWEISGRWNFGSGFPFTPTKGIGEQLTMPDGINSDILRENGEFQFLYDEYNSARLPTYHRMDVSIKKTYQFTQRSSLEASFSVSNIYNRDNIFYKNRVTNKEVYQLPILPSINLAYRF